jgi:hypothetical protein
LRAERELAGFDKLPAKFDFVGSGKCSFENLEESGGRVKGAFFGVVHQGGHLLVSKWERDFHF